MDENELRTGLFIDFGGFALVVIVVSISLMECIEGIEAYFVNEVFVLIATVITFISSSQGQVIKSRLLS